MDPKTQQSKPEHHESDEEKDLLENTKHLILNDTTAAQIKFSKQGLENIESGTSWEKLGLDPKLIERLIQLGYKKPSKIQESILRIIKSQSVVAQAQNGAGKTLGFLIPAIQSVNQNDIGPHNPASPQVIIIADTVALIQQISKILKSILQGVYNLTVDEMYSGKKEIDPKTCILISTMSQIKTASNIKKISFDLVQMVILDEADHVFEQDFSKNFFLLLVSKHLKNPNLKMIYTSATMPESFSEVIKTFQENKNIVSIELKKEELTLKNVTQYMVKYSNPQQKFDFLKQIMEKVNAQNILIFDNKKANLAELLKQLQGQGYKAELVCKAEGTVQEVQESTSQIQTKINNFLAGKYRILLTTNLLSRGIDMRKVTLVINFSLPYKFVTEDGERKKIIDLETYLHRVGRTGRFGDYGIAINFVNSANEIQEMESIKDHYKNTITELNLDNIGQLNKELEKIDEVNKEKRQYMEENL